MVKGALTCFGRLSFACAGLAGDEDSLVDPVIAHRAERGIGDAIAMWLLGARLSEASHDLGPVKEGKRLERINSQHNVADTRVDRALRCPSNQNVQNRCFVEMR